MYSFYRRIRCIGRARAWDSAKADYRNWDDETYPPPPEMRHPGITILLGSWADLQPSYIRVNRFSYTRDMMIESQKKIGRLRKRREARKYRAYQKGINEIHHR